MRNSLSTTGTTFSRSRRLPPADLQRVVQEAIDSVLDIEAFNAEIDAEREDAAWLQGIRETVKSRFADVDFERPEAD